jgi:hypothetical protein
MLAPLKAPAFRAFATLGGVAEVLVLAASEVLWAGPRRYASTNEFADVSRS